jgi:glutamate dehydrogenase/leucine dehydrogenase
MDTYSVNLGHTVPSIATGKPSSIGGSLGLLDATGYGVAFATRKVVNHLDLKKNNPKIIIQGFGHVGSVAAASLAKDGCTIIGLSDASGGVFNKKGIDIDKVKEFMSQGKRLSECPVGEVIPNKELLEQNCDILIPCAVRGQINEGNAANLKCKLIIEGANAPTTPEADKILDDRGIPVLPDIVANAAGVTVSYFEWVQGLMRLFWSEHEVLARLDQLIGTALDRVIFTADQTKRSYRMSAMTLALGRLVEARKLRGLYP